STQPVTNDATGEVLQAQLPADTTLVAPTAPPTPTPTPAPIQTPTAIATPTAAATATSSATPDASPIAGSQSQTSSPGAALQVQTVAAVDRKSVVVGKE